MKRYLLIFSVFTFTFGIFCHESSAQVRYENNTLFIGTSEPVSWYPIIAGGGMYFNHSNGRFFQIDVAANGAPRLAGHNNEVVFYNTQTGTFNSIQVAKVYNYSDARAKTGIQSLNNGLGIIQSLRPVSYNFSGVIARNSYNKFTGSNSEMGLLAQEVELVLPNLVFTDEEGHKLIDYIALIPALIDAVQTLQAEIETLKSDK